MHILYLTHSQIPSESANSIQVMNMCLAFQKRYRVTLLARPSLDAPVTAREIFQYYDLPQHFEILQTKQGKSSNIKSLRNYFFLLHNLRQKKFDLCFGRHLKGLLVTAYWGLPTVYEAHEVPKSSWEEFLIKKLCTSTNFAGLVCISSLLMEKYLNLLPHLPRKKIVVAHDGINMDFIKKAGARENQNCSNASGFRVGYVGSLKPEKGIELILRIAGALPGAQFHLVGGNEADITFWKHAARGLSNVYFHGHVSPKKAIEHQQYFDVLLAPYQQLSWGSGRGTRHLVRNEHKIIGNSPLKFFEYMAASKPIIASDLPISREVFTHGRNALLLDPEDHASWVKWINVLRQNKDLARTLADNARLEVENYTWEKRVDRIIANLSL